MVLCFEILLSKGVVIMKRTIDGLEIKQVVINAFQTEAVANYGYAHLLWLALSDLNYDTSHIYVNTTDKYCEIVLNFNLSDILVTNEFYSKAISTLKNYSDNGFLLLGAYLLKDNNLEIIKDSETPYIINNSATLEISKEPMLNSDGELITGKSPDIEYIKNLGIHIKIISRDAIRYKQEILRLLYLKLVYHNIESKKGIDVREFYNRYLDIDIFKNFGGRCYIYDNRRFHIMVFVISDMKCHIREIKNYKKRKICSNKWNEKRLRKEPFVQEIIKQLIDEGYIDNDLMPNLREYTFKEILKKLETFAKRRCIICGKEFKPKEANSLVCSQTCANKKSRYKGMINEMIKDNGYSLPLGAKERQEITNKFKQRIKRHIKRLNREDNPTKPKGKVKDWELLTSILIREIERKELDT